MRVFMLGWEFPPYISGGLGTACHGLTKGLDEVGVDVTFVLPTALPHDVASHVKLKSPTSLSHKARTQPQPPAADLSLPVTVSAAGGQTEVLSHVSLRVVPAVLQPYGTPASYEETIRRLRELQEQGKLAEMFDGADVPAEVQKLIGGVSGGYGGDLMQQVRRYAALALQLARTEQFDVVHAHDWMTYPAGLAVAAYMGKPLVVHVHSTEFDRSGQNVYQQVYDIERAGMHGADRVIAVSYLTRNVVTSRYGVPPDKVEVVYNAVEPSRDGSEFNLSPIARDEKIVLFLGRITMQKGPEYFLLAAKKVLQKYQKVRFVIVGSGDLVGKAVEMAAALGIGRHVTFTGFLRGDDVAKVFRMADLYVMPSVSEPFGIAPLEALAHNVPVIISKQSGVSEVLSHVLKVDFWDTDEMANKVLAVLRHPPLGRVLREHGQIELDKLSWRDSAEKCKGIYQDVVARH